MERFGSHVSSRSLFQTTGMKWAFSTSRIYNLLCESSSFDEIKGKIWK